jgi:quercetin dioxygenase-like cupin family protein
MSTEALRATDGRTRHTQRTQLTGGSMSNLQDLADRPLLEIWGDAVRARRIQGDRITLAIVELAPNAVVPEHRHAAEQLGMVIRGQMHFTVDGETRDLGPGGTWRILGDRPHDVVAGREGAVVIDVFSPIRSDWDEKVVVEPSPAPRWPEA